MAGKTKKSRSKKASPVLKVDSISKIPALEKILKDGKITIVLVFADWCGHCHNFQKNIWNPMCKKNAIHNRIAIRDDMVQNTSLKNSKFDYLPSLLVVDEKGQTQSFKTPDGEMTNAMPTPKSLNEMTQIVNVPVKSLNNNGMNNNGMNNMNNINNNNSVNYNNNMNFNNTPKPVNNIPKTPNSTNYATGTPYPDEPIVNEDLPSFTPTGKSYTPENIEVDSNNLNNIRNSSQKMQGGNLLATLQQVSQGIIPAGILGGLALALKRKSKKQSKKTRKVRKH
jgi:hypothetical protein